MPRRHYQFIDIDQVENVLTGLIAEYFKDYPGPIPQYQYLDGERGRGALNSALAAPTQTFGGQYLHRTVFDKAAALWRSVIMNHPFIDGNKRMGLLCCHVFLAMNGYLFTAPQAEAVEFSVAIASHQPGTDLNNISRWLHQNTVPIEHLERLKKFFTDDPAYFRMVIEALDGLSGTEPQNHTSSPNNNH